MSKRLLCLGVSGAFFLVSVLLVFQIVGVPVSVNPSWLSSSWFALLGLTVAVSVGISRSQR